MRRFSRRVFEGNRRAAPALPKDYTISAAQPSRYDGRDSNASLLATRIWRKPSCCSGITEGLYDFRSTTVAVRRSR